MKSAFRVGQKIISIGHQSDHHFGKHALNTYQLSRRLEVFNHFLSVVSLQTTLRIHILAHELQDTVLTC